MVVPCKDCTKRDLYCHSKCSDYKSWKDEEARIRNLKKGPPGTLGVAKTHHNSLRKHRRK